MPYSGSVMEYKDVLCPIQVVLWNIRMSCSIQVVLSNIRLSYALFR